VSLACSFLIWPIQRHPIDPVRLPSGVRIHKVACEGVTEVFGTSRPALTTNSQLAPRAVILSISRLYTASMRLDRIYNSSLKFTYRLSRRQWGTK